MSPNAPAGPDADAPPPPSTKEPVELTAEQAVDVARGHFQANRHGEAIAICRKVLAVEPDRFDANHLLGGCALVTGNPGVAEEHFRKALDAKPDDPVALANLGAALVGLEKFADAEDPLARAVAARPEIMPAHGYLGQVLLALDRLDEAEAAFEAAIAADPDYLTAHIGLAQVRHKQNRPDLAAAELHALTERRPEAVSVWLSLANLFRESSLPARAVDCLERALERVPDDPALQTVYADTLVECGVADRALDTFRSIVDRFPNAHQPRVRLAGCLSTLGRFDEADAEARRSLELRPGSSGGLFQLAHIHDLDPDGDEVRRMLDLVDKPAMRQQARQALRFALGRTFDAAGRYDDAFGHFQAGNALRADQSAARGDAFDADKHEEYTDRIRQVFTTEFFAERADWGSPSRTPVFIAGPPRSGTTLTEQIVASHPRAFGAGELLDVPQMARLVGMLARSPRPYPGMALDATAEVVALQARAYLRRLDDLSGGAERVTNKLPGNYVFVGLIALLFPNAPIIHTRRNAIDNCLSCYVVSFANGHAYTNDLVDLGVHWRHYAELMDHWARVLPNPMLELDYERLVAEPEETTRAILDHCGLEWDDACLSPHRHKRAVMTASKHQVRKPIYTTSVERWRRYEKHLGPLIEALGDRAPV